MLTRALVAFGLALVSSPLVIVGLRRLGVIDIPGERSSHVTPTPRGGGIAVGLGAATALLSSSSMSDRASVGVLVAACVFGLLGLLDDVVGMPALWRLALQVVTTACVIPWLVPLTGRPTVQLAGVGLLIGFWLISYVNACNFMDGINGLSVVQVVVAGTTWLVVSEMKDIPTLAAVSMVVAAAALGFAPYNFPQARLFLGDTGSYFIGAWLAAVAVLGLRAGVPPEAMLAPLSLYLADTGSTLLRRVLRGDTWHAAHHEHSYQRFVERGWSHETTTSVVGLLLVVISALGLLSLTESVGLRVAADVAAAAVLAAYVKAPDWLARRHSATRPAHSR